MTPENARVFFWVGFGDFLLGGALLALWGGPAGTGVGTLVALAGLTMMVWGWFASRRGGSGDHE